MTRTIGAPIDYWAQGGDLGVELRMLWGETLLDAGVFVRPEHPVLAGLTKNCQFFLAGSNLPAKEFPVLRFEEGEYQVLFARGMDGEIEEKGARTPLSQFMKGSLAATDTAIEGAYAVGLPVAGAVRLEFGSGLRMEASLQQRPKPATLPWHEGINYHFLNVLLLLFFFMGGLVVVASNFAYDSDVLGDDFSRSPWVRTKFFPPDAKPTPSVMPRRTPTTPEKVIPVQTAGRSGDEGAAGKRDGPDKKARRDSKGDPNDANRSSGSLVSLIGKGFSGLAPVLSQTGLGGSLREAIGQIRGPLVGDSRGLEGLGIKGHGPGSGGDGQTIGIGPIDTKTGISGLDKVPVNLGSPKHFSPVIESDEPGPISNYDREIVRRVVHDHAGQIRACYERQLLSSPQLEGKVVVRWQINPDGRVSDVRLQSDESTVEDRPLQQCIMNQIAAWEFPPPKGGGVALIRYPWILRPTGG
jgi:TonB family protein